MDCVTCVNELNKIVSNKEEAEPYLMCDRHYIDKQINLLRNEAMCEITRLRQLLAEILVKLDNPFDKIKEKKKD